MLRDHYHHISAWLPTDHRNPVPTALPLSASWNGNKSKAVLPGSAWSGTHSSAPHSSMPRSDATMRRGEDPIPERRDAGLGGGDPSIRARHQLRRCRISLRADERSRAASLLSYCSTSPTAKCTHCLHRSCAPA